MAVSGRMRCRSDRRVTQGGCAAGPTGEWSAAGIAEAAQSARWSCPRCPAAAGVMFAIEVAVVVSRGLGWWGW